MFFWDVRDSNREQNGIMTPKAGWTIFDIILMPVHKGRLVSIFLACFVKNCSQGGKWTAMFDRGARKP
jgi:hypothetical protein